jgi:Fur family transcriptional regulator, ferric uptake regulator
MAAGTFRQPSLVQDLRRRGVRITAQRKAVVETIQEADVHLDAHAVLERTRRRNPRVDRATVYRTLDLLKKFGLIEELDLMHLEGEKHYYEARIGTEHIHLACFRCGGIEEFSSASYEQFKAEIARSCGFHIQVSRMEVGGLCKSCSGKSGGGEAQRKEPLER